MINKKYETFKINYLASNKIDFSVYHYTSGKNLQSIITKGELWLSERKYMNDVKEVSYTRNLIYECCKEQGLGLEPEDIDQFFLSQSKEFIFSTSLNSDVINMWSYYSDIDSYCIEFKKNKLKHFFINKMKGTEGMALFDGKVIYEKNKQKKMLNEYIEAMCDEAIEKESNFIDDKHPITNRLYSRAEYDFNKVYSICKQNGHSCEAEYRFIFEQENVEDFYVKKGLFVPYKKVAAELGMKLPIESIMIGPNNHEEISKESLRLFLDANGYQNVQIKQSKLSIR